VAIATFVLLWAAVSAWASRKTAPKGTPAPSGAPDYREMARQAAIDNQVPPALFVRLIERESREAVE